MKRAHWFFGNRNSTKPVRILRWVARFWSLFAFALAMVVAFRPDPHATGPIALRDAFILSLWLVAILGLILAWRWERVGALLTIFMMPTRELLYVLIYKEWVIYFLLVWALVIPPAGMYLLASFLDRKGVR